MTENNQKIETERQTDLRIAREILKKMEGRINTPRFRVYETDGVYLKFIRGYAQLLQVVNNIQRDEELDELGKRIEALEHAKDGAPISLCYPDEEEEDAGKR